MLPHLPLQNTLNPDVEQFLTALKKAPFSGEIRADFASRLLTSTDNSIYQILPQAVLFPKTTEDVVEIFQLANQHPFQTLTFSPRGGGTGTNGQSLSPGIILDCSKYMTQILDVNLDEQWVRVQPGVVLDQLNTHLKSDGVFFAPNLAPSSRATLGGMINTDACGKGSRIYGRTSDHILELTWVLTDGTVGTSHAIPVEYLADRQHQSSRVGHIYKQVNDIVNTKQALIEQQFPKMPRFLTGYNLAKVYAGDRQTFDLNRILAGSEGTLAVVTEAKLKLTPIPQAQDLLVIHYDCFDDALNGSQALLEFEPAAIETIDETILELAKHDEIYDRVQSFIAGAKAINLVEFVGEDAAQLNAKIEQIQHHLAIDSTHQAIGYYRTQTALESKHLWDLRKRGVGLLGNRQGPRKPIAFIEDTAVPPSHLPQYVQEFKALLTRYDLDYAMFGHVDVGCLHVRPALNMQMPEDERLIRDISDQVAALVRQYGGVMWAEHGRGFRSEYTPLFFGEELYEDLRRVKAAFDPHNRLNPGKIVTPAGSDASVVQLEAPLKGHFDRQVPTEMQASYEVAFSCNGNGACFDVSPDAVMCPSYKGSRERIHSPKGRASLLREWLRQLAMSHEQTKQSHTQQNPKNQSQAFDQPASFPVKVWHTLTKVAGRYDYSHEVYDGLHGCLSCKACASQCPIHVDIPSLKAKFLQRYYTRYLRLPRDYLIGHIETLSQWQARWPEVTNLMIHNPLSLSLLRTVLRLVDPPWLSISTVPEELKAKNAPPFEMKHLAQADRTTSVILLQDAFTSMYEAPVVLATYDVLTQLGFQVYVSPPIVSGKPLHVLGFLDEFAAVAQRTMDYLSSLQTFGIPMVGIEPSIVLTYRYEYATLGQAADLGIQLLQEFLVTHANRLPKLEGSHPYHLLGHCTEKTLALTSQQQWKQVFEAAELPLSIVNTGCCGMAGMYGYEAEHLDSSRSIYELSWDPHLPNELSKRPYVLATGISCRSQVGRFAGWRPLHPMQALQQAIAQYLCR